MHRTCFCTCVYVTFECIFLCWVFEHHALEQQNTTYMGRCPILRPVTNFPSLPKSPASFCCRIFTKSVGVASALPSPPVISPAHIFLPNPTSLFFEIPNFCFTIGYIPKRKLEYPNSLMIEGTIPGNRSPPLHPTSPSSFTIRLDA